MKYIIGASSFLSFLISIFISIRWPESYEDRQDKDGQRDYIHPAANLENAFGIQKKRKIKRTEKKIKK